MKHVHWISRASKLGAVGAVVLAAAGCGDDGDGSREDEAAEVGEDGAETADDLPPPNMGLVPDVEADPEVAALDLGMVEVAQMNQPLVLASREGDEAVFVAEREGRVYRLEPDGEGDGGVATYTPDDEPLVDISDEVVLEGEQALGGMTFSPDGERFYLSYSAAPAGDARIISYEYDDTDASVDESSRREVLEVEQPYDTHNNGTVIFGPDGYLYIGMGDGGNVGDPHGFGQDPSTLLGTILRIDPESAVGSEEPYEVPEDNPFVDGEEGREEVWLYGVRNPWRFSFDAATGDLWIGDVGQESREEINLLPAEDGGGRGANLGWNEMEGSQPYEDGVLPPGSVLPVFDYPNHREGGDGGCAVIGGFVHRGDSIAELNGAYLFGDFCNPQIRALTVEDGEVVHHTPLDGLMADDVTALGQDADGEIYLLSESGGIYRIVAS